jgi:hypothetical protein
VELEACGASFAAVDSMQRVVTDTADETDSLNNQPYEAAIRMAVVLANSAGRAHVHASMHGLSDIVLLFDEDADEEKCEQDVALLAELLDADPAIDAQGVIEILTKDLRTVLPRTVALIREANSRLSQRPPIDIAPIIARVQSAKLDYVAKMAQLVEGTTHLQRVLTLPWFEKLRGIILSWDPVTVFELPTHTAFIGYYTDAICYAGDFLQSLDDAFVQLSKYGSIKQKRAEIAGASAGYVSTAFEMLVLRRFAIADVIDEYEPTLPSGGRAEGRVALNGQHVLVEARVKMDEERPGGGFDPEDMGLKLFGKLQEKYATQYAGVAEPLVVFFSLGASVLHDIEAEAMIAEVMKDGSAATLSAVVLCDFYQPHKMWLWCNHEATHALAPEAVKALYELFPLHEFTKTGLI